MVSPDFGERWRDRLETHVTTLAGLIEGERAGRAQAGPPAAEAIASAGSGCSRASSTSCSAATTAADEDELVDTTSLWVRSIAAT